MSLGLTLALLGIAALPHSSAQAAVTSPVADAIFVNGVIWSPAGSDTPAQAVAVADGKIERLGTRPEVEAVAGPKTRVVDLQGHTLMPGLNDVHAHLFVGATRQLFECRISKSAPLDAVFEQVAACAKRTPRGKWIYGGAWDVSLLSKLSTADSLSRLDRISAKHPVALRDSSGHNVWANSLAMSLAKIDPASATGASDILLSSGPNPAPTGVLLEQAAEAVISVVPQYTAKQQLDASAESVRIANSVGVTGFMDANANLGTLSAYRELDRQHALSAWFVPAILWSHGDSRELAGRALFERRGEFRTPHMFPDAVKVYLDGVAHSRTAAFLQPYVRHAPEDACEQGHTSMSIPELAQLIAEMDQKGVIVKMHAAGDASVREALDAVETVRALRGPLRMHHHIAHASFIDAADLPRFAELGVVADLSPMLWYPSRLTEAVQAQIGPARTQAWWPIRDLLASGARAALGTDWPSGSRDQLDPWSGIEALVTRGNPFGEAPGKLNAQQAIDLPAALTLMTLTSARAMGLEARTGSIEVGKSADLIVLDRNLFATPPADLSEVQVVMTMFEGHIVYERPGGVRQPNAASAAR